MSHVLIPFCLLVELQIQLSKGMFDLKCLFQFTKSDTSAHITSKGSGLWKTIARIIRLRKFSANRFNTENWLNAWVTSLYPRYDSDSAYPRKFSAMICQQLIVVDQRPTNNIILLLLILPCNSWDSFSLTIFFNIQVRFM